MLSAGLGITLLVVLAAPLGWSAQRLAHRLAGESHPPANRLASILAAAAMAASAGLAAPATGPAPAGLLLGWSLLTLALVDLTALRLPDIITWPLCTAGIVVAWLRIGGQAMTPVFDPGALCDHLLGAAAGYAALAGLAAAYRRLRARDGLGLGDAKLAACAGAWLGWRALPLVVLIACGLAFAWVAVRLATRGRSVLSEPLAFGAPLAAALWICWLAPPELWASPA